MSDKEQKNEGLEANYGHHGPLSHGKILDQISTIKRLASEYPNDQEFGAKVRELLIKGS